MADRSKELRLAFGIGPQATEDRTALGTTIRAWPGWNPTWSSRT
jgi:hypothetical protein